MKILTKEDLLKKEDLKVEKVELDKAEFVYVKQMTGREKDCFEQSLMKEVKGADGAVSYERSLDDFRAKLAVNTLCDEKGVCLLDASDAPVLSQHMSAARLEVIVNKVQELNKITEKDKENMVKNSEAAQSEDSISGSVKS